MKEPMRKRLRILFFVESLRSGGKERRIVELIKGLRANPMYDIGIVLTRHEIHYEEIHRLGIPVFYCVRRFFKKDPIVFFSFLSVARKFQPDIIHVWGNMVALYSLPAKIILGVPLVNSQITDTTVNARPFAKSLNFRFSDRIISNTELGLKTYEAPMEKSQVIYNGFSFSRVKKLKDARNVRSDFAIGTSYCVAMVATFSEYKDYNTYIMAAILLCESRNDITFLCVGDGNSTSLQALVPDQLKELIRFPGRQQEVESLMNVCDIGVLVNDINKHGEGISNALMEFMSLGKPVIATRFGGSTELVIDGVTGYLIPPFDPLILADRINHLLKEPSLRNKMGSAARERIHTHFSIERMVESFTEVYHELTNRSGHE